MAEQVLTALAAEACSKSWSRKRGQRFTRKYPSAVQVARAAPVVDNYPQCGQGGVRWTAPSKRHPLAREMRVPEETMNFAQRIRTNALLVLYNYWKELRGSRPYPTRADIDTSRSEEHTSELQSLMRTSYAVFFLNKK